MAITMDKAAKQRREALSEGRLEGAAELEVLMLAGLGPQLLRLYGLLDTENFISAMDLRDKMELGGNHVDNLLNKLRRWGLVERALNLESDKIYYSWRKTGNDASMEGFARREVPDGD